MIQIGINESNYKYKKIASLRDIVFMGIGSKLNDVFEYEIGSHTLT